jgi:glycosyltransferase involved in cell wall biosynthesis
MNAPRVPKVSVFMPCYNQQDYVAAAIESVLVQDYPELELVIGDDCSTDATWAIVQRYQAAHPDRIRAFRNETNLGITRNCNQVLRRCTGDYVAFHAGDDLWLPGKLNAQVAAMEAAGASLSYHDIEVFDSDSGRTLSCWNSGPQGRAPVVGDIRAIGRRVIEDGTSFMAALSVMVRRDAIPPQGYDERVKVASDWLMWIDVCHQGRGPVVFLPAIYARYRRHASNVTSSMMKYFDDELVVLALTEFRHPERAASIARARRRIQYRAAIHHLQAGREKIARYYLLRAMWYPEYVWKAPLRWLASLFGLRRLLMKSPGKKSSN